MNRLGRRGFKRIERLVAVAIVGLAVALLLPALWDGRPKDASLGGQAGTPVASTAAMPGQELVDGSFANFSEFMRKASGDPDPVNDHRYDIEDSSGWAPRPENFDDIDVEVAYDDLWHHASVVITKMAPRS